METVVGRSAGKQFICRNHWCENFHWTASCTWQSPGCGMSLNQGRRRDPMSRWRAFGGNEHLPCALGSHCMGCGWVSSVWWIGRFSELGLVRPVLLPAAPFISSVILGLSFLFSKRGIAGISLLVQWLRLCTPSAGGPGSIPCLGTTSHTPQLKILHAAMKIEDLACGN